MNKNNSTQKRRITLLIISITTVMILLLTLEYYIMVRSNREQSYRTAAVLIDQIENILENNKRKEKNLVETLKEDYITKAKAVSYIIDKVPGTEYDITELSRIAELMRIDEIHVFDESGTIFSGTVPRYYGYSFDSGEQMAYFKPMLKDKSLSMCQDVTPNTAENKSMMYALCWSETGNYMVQIGIEPVHLLEELRMNELPEVIKDMPTYDGLEIFVADVETKEIIAASDAENEGKNLSDVGLPVVPLSFREFNTYQSVVHGINCYCSLYRTDEYFIAVTQEVDRVNTELPITMLTVFIYLLIAGIIILFIVRRYHNSILNEKHNANTDAITGLKNRRAYEDDLHELDKSHMEKDLMYITMDINGLKAANDVFGHDMGDNMIKCTAQAIKGCLDQHGNIYRTGGDEFIFIGVLNDSEIPEIQKKLDRYMKEWSTQNNCELTLSMGHASTQEFPNRSLSDLAKISDQRMYKSKSAFYESSGKDRRRRS